MPGLSSLSKILKAIRAGDISESYARKARRAISKKSKQSRSKEFDKKAQDKAGKSIILGSGLASVPSSFMAQKAGQEQRDARKAARQRKIEQQKNNKNKKPKRINKEKY